jgi:very-short-patch-repair endonuclease
LSFHDARKKQTARSIYYLLKRWLALARFVATKTAAEHKLWMLLHSRRLRGAKFRRNHPIGPFFADFCCLDSRLIIEVDGGQHADEAEVALDHQRTAYLRARGFNVMRFWNLEVFTESERVLEHIRSSGQCRPEAEPSP